MALESGGALSSQFERGAIAGARVAVSIPSSAPRNVSTSPVAQPPLRVAIAAVAPFVLPRTATPEGFSVDLWNEVARRMHVEFTWTVLPAQPALLPAVEHGDVDVAIAAITMTPELEKAVDFSLPYFDSGLQIIVRAQNESSLVATFQSIPWLAICQLVGITIVIVLILANLILLVEPDPARRAQTRSRFSEALFPGTR